jgi:WD40 repeat protein
MRRACLLLVGTLVACAHSEPFTPGTYVPGGPFTTGPLRRLTFNTGTDRTPAWLPDGSAFLYSLERQDDAIADRCLAIMPADGGSLQAMICVVDAPSADTVDAFEWFAPAADGRLAYLRASTKDVASAHASLPDHEAVVVGTLSHPVTTSAVQVLPFFAPSGISHTSAAYIHWLGDSALVYVAQSARFPHSFPGSPTYDTIKTGLEIATIDLRGATPVLAVVPGTDQASSVAVGGTADTIYFTKNGDSQVYRYAFSSGQTTVAHDFGAAGIARDVQIVGARLVAVVGGAVIDSVDPFIGRIQVDSGGYLHFVDLLTAADTVLADSSFRFRHPALSPDGRRVVSEVVTINRSDLWLVELP